MRLLVLVSALLVCAHPAVSVVLGERSSDSHGDAAVRISTVKTREVSEAANDYGYGFHQRESFDDRGDGNGNTVSPLEANDDDKSELAESSFIAERSTSGSSSAWTTLKAPTALSSVAVGFTGQVFGIAKSSQLPYAFDARTSSWSRFEPKSSSKVKQVLVSCDSTLYKVDAAGRLYKKGKGSFSGEWAAVGVESHSLVAIGKDDDIWSIDAAGNAHYFIKSKDAFYPAHTKLSSVAVGCEGAVWGVSTDGKLLERDEGSWKPRGNNVKAVQARQSVYVLGDGGNLWKYRRVPSDSNEPARKFWYNLNRQFAQFSLGPDDTLWGVDSSGVAVKHNGENMEANLNAAERDALQLKQGGIWEVLPGSAGIRELSTGQDGEIYGVTSDLRVVKYDKAVSKKWENIPSPKLVRVATGCDGVSLWGVTADGFTHRYRGNGKWVRYSEKLSDVNIGENEDYVYGLKVGSHRLVRYDRKSRRWKLEITKGKHVTLQSLSAGCARTVWGVNMDGELVATSHEHSPGVWNTLGEGVRAVAVGRSVYILDAKNYLFEYRRPAPGQKEGKQNWRFLHKQLRSVDTNPAGEIVGIDLSGKAVRFRPMKFAGSGSWKIIQELAPVAHLAIGSRNDIYALDHYGVVLRYTSNRRWTPMTDGSDDEGSRGGKENGAGIVYLEQLSVGCDGVAWGVKTKGKVYRMPELEVGWEQVNSDRDDIAMVSVGSAKHVWGINAKGVPFMFDAASSVWQRSHVPTGGDPLVDISVTCRGDVWAVGKSGVVYKRVALTPASSDPDAAKKEAASGHVPKIKVASQWLKYGINALEVHVGYRALLVDKSHVVWKYEDEVDAKTPWKKWVKLGGGVVTVSTGADGTTWGLDRRGHVWSLKEGVAPQRAPPVLGIPEPTATPEPYLEPQPDDQGLSPYVAGTNDRLDTPGSVQDKDDVTTMIRQKEEADKFATRAGAKSPYNPYEFEEEAIGNSVFNSIDRDVQEKTHANFPKPADEVFKTSNPPF